MPVSFAWYLCNPCVFAFNMHVRCTTGWHAMFEHIEEDVALLNIHSRCTTQHNFCPYLVDRMLFIAKHFGMNRDLNGRDDIITAFSMTARCIWMIYAPMSYRIYYIDGWKTKMVSAQPCIHNAHTYREMHVVRIPRTVQSSSMPNMATGIWIKYYCTFQQFDRSAGVREMAPSTHCH